MLEQLKYKVWEESRRLARFSLARFDMGSVSGADRGTGLFVIKPEGVPFDELVPEQFVVIDFDGNIIEGECPSRDWQTHLVLYKAFNCGGIAHSYSEAASGFAAACRPVPVFSAVHADYFGGDVPATRLLTKEEIEGNYRESIGKIITEAFVSRNPLEIPAVIVSGHEPFVWGEDCTAAVKNAALLEAVAKSALCALTLSPGLPPLSKTLVDFRHKGE